VPAGQGRQQGTTDEGDASGRLVTLGRVTGPYGLQGWLKIHSDTDPRDNIVHYAHWWLGRGGRWERREVEAGRLHGKTVVAKLAGCDDRDAAAAMKGAEIAVRRSQLAADLAPGEYYWTDLEGLRVVTIEGVALGRVDHLFETGANDVMVVEGERERLLPFVLGQVVREVDLAGGVIRVDWDPDF
jgi:16S rRNA processing protein RimM